MSTSELEDGSPDAVAEAGSGTEDRTPPRDEAGSERVVAERKEIPEMDSMTLTMTFELGQVRMSLGDLRALGRNVVIPLHRESPPVIAIHCGGRRLGTGEAVEIDQQLGIRILDWSVK